MGVAEAMRPARPWAVCSMPVLLHTLESAKYAGLRPQRTRTARRLTAFSLSLACLREYASSMALLINGFLSLAIFHTTPVLFLVRHKSRPLLAGVAHQFLHTPLCWRTCLA